MKLSSCEISLRLWYWRRGTRKNRDQQRFDEKTIVLDFQGNGDKKIAEVNFPAKKVRKGFIA